MSRRVRKVWSSLAALGFPGYQISNYAEIREEGKRRARATNAAGALNLVDSDGVKRCRAVGKLCRLVHGDDAPGATQPREKLSDPQVREILTSSDAPTVLAARFGVSPSTIKAARARRTHTDVEVEGRAQYTQDRHAFGQAAAA